MADLVQCDNPECGKSVPVANKVNWWVIGNRMAHPEQYVLCSLSCVQTVVATLVGIQERNAAAWDAMVAEEENQHV
jgi:hypothetical protein